MNESFILIIRNGHYRVADEGLSSWLVFKYLITGMIVQCYVNLVMLSVVLNYQTTLLRQRCDGVVLYSFEM